MGTQAIINLKHGTTLAPFSVYMHYDGYNEAVYAFYNATYDFFKSEGGIDFSYFQARFLQTIGHFFGGTSSVGVLPYTPQGNGRRLYTLDIAGPCARFEDSEAYSYIYNQCMEYLQSTTYDARKKSRALDSV